MNRRDLITIDPDILGGVPVFKRNSRSYQDLVRISGEQLLAGRISGVLSFGKPRVGPSSIRILRAGIAFCGGCMRILLDEWVPWPMHRLLQGHTCSSVQADGWSGTKKWRSVQRAQGEFDLFIT